MLSVYKRAFFWSILFFVFFVKSLSFIDPDFGWRLKAGEYILQSGIPKTDLFTYTMSHFPWVDHAWFVSGLFYFVHSRLGYKFLGAICSIVVLLCAWGILKVSAGFSKRRAGNGGFVEKIANNNWKEEYGDIFFLMSLGLIFMPFGIRAQIFSWGLFLILMWLVMGISNWKKSRRWVPLLFLVWGNIHGSWAAGLSFLSIWIFSSFYRNKKIDKVDFLIWLSSIAVTFMNPYGVSTWREVWSSVSDRGLRWSIAEWTPSIFVFDLSMIFYFCLSLVLVVKYWKKFLLEEKVVYLFFFIQAVASKRHLPIWGLVALPISNLGMGFLVEEMSKIKHGLKRLKASYKYLVYFVWVLMILKIGYNLWSARNVSEGSFYPKEAVVYLKNNPSDGRVFSYYGWGGYLIWKYPEKKVFIDGRMPSWEYKNESIVDLKSAFDTYRGITEGEVDAMELMNKYQVDTILWPVTEEDKGLYKYLEERYNSLLAALGREPETKKEFIFEIVQGGFVEEYKDEVSVVYGR